MQGAPQQEGAGSVPVVLDLTRVFGAAERQALETAFAAASRILEYGAGASTALAARLGRPIISVESDRQWAVLVQDYVSTLSDSARVHHVDIGPTGEWGAPARAKFHRRFPGYALSVWDLPDLGEPDLVFIDGRFRPACLAAVVLRARRPTSVLFDDYVGRDPYHRVEALVGTPQMIGRMARFEIKPGQIPPDLVTEVIGWFNDPL